MMKIILLGLSVVAIKNVNSQSDTEDQEIYQENECLDLQSKKHPNQICNHNPSQLPMLDYVRNVIKQNYHLPEQSGNVHPPMETALRNLEKLKRTTSGHARDPDTVPLGTPRVSPPMSTRESYGNTNVERFDDNFDSDSRVTSDFEFEPTMRESDLNSDLSMRSSGIPILADRKLNFSRLKKMLYFIKKEVMLFSSISNMANHQEVMKAKQIIAGKIKRILQKILTPDTPSNSRPKINSHHGKSG